MSLRDLALLYLLAGLACAVAVYRASPDRGSRAVASAALAVPLWPLWAPIALTRPSMPKGLPSPTHEAAERVRAALREAMDAAAGTQLESLLSREAAARIDAEVTRAAARHAELSRLLHRDGFGLAAAEERVASLAGTDSPSRALSTARLHLENVRRLRALCDRDARALDELADLVHALGAQLTLARFAGSSVEGIGGIVSDVWARVEGLGAAMDADQGEALQQRDVV
jgi:hypothetical protein